MKIVFGKVKVNKLLLMTARENCENNRYDEGGTKRVIVSKTKITRQISHVNEVL